MPPDPPRGAEVHPPQSHKILWETLSSLKVVRQTYLSSADAARAPIAVFDLEMSW